MLKKNSSCSRKVESLKLEMRPTDVDRLHVS